MTLKQTSEIIQLQEKISIRLSELGYADTTSANNIARHLAEIAVLGASFAETTLPLFLSVGHEHTEPLAQLIVSIKCDLEELGDAINDIDPELRSLMHFLNERSVQ